MLEKAKWIWINEEYDDLYAEFYKSFTASGKNALCHICCDGDYTLFVNGKYAASGQYGDFEHYKIFDTVDISELIREGDNSLAVLVWHHGAPTSRYKPAKAGLIFELSENGKLLAASDEKTLARKSRAYENGRQKFITIQLGFGYAYDATREDEWKLGGGEGFSPATVVSKNCSFYPRPIKKHELAEKRLGRLIKEKDCKYFLYDLGEETVGFLSLALQAKCDTDITVAYGEHIIDGGVRRIIDQRDYSVEYRARQGRDEFTNYMLRLAGRYIELWSSEPISPEYVSLIPIRYPVQRKDASFLTGRDKLIYDVCVNTLELCMMEHYVDCPWREQCLYAFDSRNQMLSGYYAFSDGNFEYARSNLKLMGMDRRDDKLLSICSPCGMDLTIPSFSLHFIVGLKEYIEYSKDISFGKELDGKVRELLSAILGNRGEGGLIKRFTGANHWNFYDWSDNAQGTLTRSQAAIPDVFINTLAIIALDAYRKICAACGIDFPYESDRDELAALTREGFFDKNEGLFFVSEENHSFTELANSLAILAGLASESEAKHICEAMKNKKLEECSLSMRTFRYDAYIKTDLEAYREEIISEFRRDWGRMLDAGATSVWETANGAADFSGHGSLCHGWSAIPVYYYNILKKDN